MASTLLEGEAAMVGGEGETSEGAIMMVGNQRGKLEWETGGGNWRGSLVLSPPFGKTHPVANFFCQFDIVIRESFKKKKIKKIKKSLGL